LLGGGAGNTTITLLGVASPVPFTHWNALA